MHKFKRRGKPEGSQEVIGRFAVHAYPR